MNRSAHRYPCCTIFCCRSSQSNLLLFPMRRACTSASPSSSECREWSSFSGEFASQFSISSGSPFLRAHKRLGSPSPLSGGGRAYKTAKLEDLGAEPAATTAVSFSALEGMVHASAACPTACRPHDYEDYLKRLATFRMPFQWFAKENHLSPLQCARHGWCLIGHETLLCQASQHPMIGAQFHKCCTYTPTSNHFSVNWADGELD